MSVSSLCQSCALCCDGSLFATVPLEERERAGEGVASFLQPCAALAGSACSRYATRPAACRKFTCLLAGALAEGEVDDEEALARVEEARGLIAAVEAHLPVSEEARGLIAALEAQLPVSEEARGLIAAVEAHLPVSEAPGSVMQRARQLQDPSPALAISRDAAENFLRRHFLGRHRR